MLNSACEFSRSDNKQMERTVSVMAEAYIWTVWRRGVVAITYYTSVVRRSQDADDMTAGRQQVGALRPA